MKNLFALTIAGIIGAAFIALLIALPFMLAWNYAVVAAIDGTNEINFWQALVLALLIGFMCNRTDSK